MAQGCPVCGNNLLPIRQGELRGVCCLTPTCTFNFEDQRCPQCGGNVSQADRPELGRYVARCDKGHEWNVIN